MGGEDTRAATTVWEPRGISGRAAKERGDLHFQPNRKNTRVTYGRAELARNSRLKPAYCNTTIYVFSVSTPQRHPTALAPAGQSTWKVTMLMRSALQNWSSSDSPRVPGQLREVDGSRGKSMCQLCNPQYGRTAGCVAS